MDAQFVGNRQNFECASKMVYTLPAIKVFMIFKDGSALKKFRGY